MKIGTLEKLKFKNLQRRLKLPLWQAVGLLESLRLFAVRHADRGDIGRFDNETIAAAIEWSGNADELIAALVASDHLTCLADRRRLLIVGWKGKRGLRIRRHKIPKAIRIYIISRDKGLCRYCRALAGTIDHLFPVSRGGSENVSNLVACCSPCNSRKLDRTPEEAGMILLEITDG